MLKSIVSISLVIAVLAIAGLGAFYLSSNARSGLTSTSTSTFSVSTQYSAVISSLAGISSTSTSSSSAQTSLSANTVSSSSGSPGYEFIGTAVVHGLAVGFPCAALRLPCPHYNSSSSGTANLILFNGKYYYFSNITVNDIVYSVWYDNATYYCVSPAFQSESTCPP